MIRGGAGIYYDTVLFVTRLEERATIGPAGNGRSQVPGTFFSNPFTFPQLALPGPLSPFNGFNVFNPVVGSAIFSQGLVPTKITAQNFIDIRNAQVPVILSQLQTAGTAGLSGIDLGAHQRFSFPLLYAASLVMVVAALVLGVFPV